MIRLCRLSIAFFSVLLLGSCSTDDLQIVTCVDGMLPIYEYTNPDGIHVQVYNNGEAYIIEDGVCEFGAQFFTPGFEDVYVRNENGVFIDVDGVLFKAFRNFTEDFEELADDFDFLISDISPTDRLFDGFTMQSPSAKTVEEYVQLRQCILNETCDFIDNRFDLVPDPVDADNAVLKFYSIAPSTDMVTAKSSIVSSLLFFEKGDDFWFEGNFYLEGDYPTTIADFESSYFEGSLGPRIFFDNDVLFVENKFGPKLKFEQAEGSKISFPKNQWVTLKIHLKYDEVNGEIELWQDDQLIIDATGPNMPVDFWIQDRLEIGITATAAETTLYVDDVRISDEEF